MRTLMAIATFTALLALLDWREGMIKQGMLDLEHASYDQPVQGESRNAKKLRAAFQDNWEKLRPEGLVTD